MATVLKKSVSRLVKQNPTLGLPFDVVVELVPPGLVRVRRARTKEVYEVGIASVFWLAAKQAAMSKGASL